MSSEEGPFREAPPPETHTSEPRRYEVKQKSTMATRMTAFATVLALLFAACGSSNDAASETSTVVDETAESTETTEAMAEEETGTTEMVDETGLPSHIVSLSPTATEMLFAMGAGSQVVAADSYSNFPAEAPTTDLSGFEPSLEAIIGYEPDLVILSFDPGEIVSGLEQAGVPSLVLPSAATLDEMYAQIADLGIATGQIDGAAALNASIQDDLAAIAESVTAEADGTVYHELDQTYYSASSGSFIGQIYTILGLTNIADEADTDGYGYPQLSPEYILEADPTLIVITDQGGYTADDVSARPGWDAITAVSSGNVLVVDADSASRWGPRIVDFARLIADQIAPVPAS